MFVNFVIEQYDWKMTCVKVHFFDGLSVRNHELNIFLLI